MNDAELGRQQLLRYCGLAYGISWLLWIPVALLHPPRGVSLPLIVAGGFAPSFAAFWLSDREGRRDLRRRFAELRRIPPFWWVFLVLFHPFVALGSNWISMRLGGPSVALDRATLLDPLSLVVWLAIAIVGGPLAEEFGWRGYALDRLQAFGGAVNASVALGILWALWHLPLFFVPGTSQGAIGFGSWAFWLWTTTVITQTAVYTWIYNNTNRSIFGAVLFHFMHNATFSALVGSSGTLPIEFQVGTAAISIVAFLVVVSIWRARATRSPAGTA
jgi:membrane protease YdiL (CAAX protease family)